MAAVGTLGMMFHWPQFLDNAKLHFTVCSTKYHWKKYLCLSTERFPQSVGRL